VGFAVGLLKQRGLNREEIEAMIVETLERQFEGGTLTSPIVITAGAQPNQVVLASDPGITVNVDAYDRERTVFMAGPLRSSAASVALIVDSPVIAMWLSTKEKPLTGFPVSGMWHY